MIIQPYVRNPVPPDVTLLQPDGTLFGETDDPDSGDWPERTRLWGAWDTVRRLVNAGVGEALCWNNEEIRWRASAPEDEAEDDWRVRSSDACVLRLDLEEVSSRKVLTALTRWRDWLASYGASPTGTVGAASMSLLRARLDRELVCSSGERPPLQYTTGGRQIILTPGSYSGRLELWDMPAAYASTLADLRYGRSWVQLEPGEVHRHWDQDLPLFVRATVRVPELPFGPLVKRLRRPPGHNLTAALFGSTYPSGCQLSGVWTREELQAAVAAGSRIVRLDGGWVHLSGWRPFAPWWEAIREGREIPGIGGMLAKMTGNSLIGRFSMDPTVNGHRSVKRRDRRRMTNRRLRARPTMLPAHDLAETVTGRTRAALFTGCLAAGDRLVSAHTDGIWVRAGAQPPAGWRRKERACQLELVDPQTLRYRKRVGADWVFVVAGCPPHLAAQEFERRWAKVAV